MSDTVASPLAPVSVSVEATEVHARSPQISTRAPDCPGGSATWNRGLRLVTMAPLGGATAMGGARTHMVPLRTKPALQVTTQRLAVHCARPSEGALHATPHAPQCVFDMVMSVSQPSPGFMLQSPAPVAQVSPQRPAVHEGVAPAAVGQSVPHAPQLRGSVLSSDSQPLSPLPSQLP